MSEYCVHFSFYSEEYGNFDDIGYCVKAKTPFEARKLAWDICDNDSDTMFRSNIKQFAVTWTPNLLDAGDYFYSHAADIKQYLGRLTNVSFPNDRIANDERKTTLDVERYGCISALQTLNDVAKDLHAANGMIPPSIYEELYYAERLCKQLGYSNEADALLKWIEKAKKWDQGAIYTIRDMFKDGYIMLCGETMVLNEHFSRSGIYPIYNKTDERDYSYIRRWQNKWKIDSLRQLSYYTETDVIKNSAGNLDYSWQHLLIDCKTLTPEYQTPENQLWRPLDSSKHNEDIQDGMLFVENLITGQRMFCDGSVIIGVLRPDIVARLDYDALSKEYTAIHCENAADDRSSVGYDADTEEEELER